MPSFIPVLLTTFLLCKVRYIYIYIYHTRSETSHHQTVGLSGRVAVCTDICSRNLDSVAAEMRASTDSVRGFPHEMPATDTRYYSLAQFRHQHRLAGTYKPHNTKWRPSSSLHLSLWTYCSAWERRSCPHGAPQACCSVCRSFSWSRLKTTFSGPSTCCLDQIRRDSNTSGNLEACHPTRS